MKKTFFSVGRENKLILLTAATALSLLAPTRAFAGNEGKMKFEMSQQQTHMLSGTVVDEAGEPIVGATVVVVGGKGGAVTNVNGEFTLEGPANATIQITSIGFVTQKLKLTGRHQQIVLKEDHASLDEVVVLGYGAGQRKQDLSASVGVLENADKLAQRPVSSTESMIQGQLAGVTVASNGGDPTSTPSIVIRGQGSMNGDNVLWVVDGVPGAPIPSLNDIESIVVLKDAASAAIYGATSGAGGCVLVTTKKAKEGAVSLSYDGIFGIRQAANLPHALTAQQQIEAAKRSYSAAGLDLPQGWDITKNPYIGTNRTDWIDEIFRTAAYQRHNVVLNTGTKTAKNRLSYAYDGNDGVLISTFNKSHTIHYNGAFDINKWITITEDFTWRNSQSRGANTTSPENGAIMNALHMPSSASVYNADGTYGGITEPGNAYPDIHGDAINPVRILSAENIYNKTSDIFTTTSLQIHDVIPGLKFTSRFSFNVSNNFYKSFNPIRQELGKPKLFNEMNESGNRYDKWMTENTLTYDNSFGKHTVGVLLSTTADQLTLRELSVYGRDFSDESTYLQYLAYAGSTTPKDYLTGPDTNVALVSRLAYSYDDRYFLTASWRRDYAGRLPKEHNHGDFPAVTAAWKISNESWFPKSQNFNLLKLRASWGRVGNLGSIGYGYKANLLESTVWAEQAQYGLASNTLWGNLIYFGTALNPNLTWETSEQWDLGLDATLLRNRLSVGIDYFNKRTFNLIQRQSIGWPSTMGIDPMLVNLGEVRNQGVEVQASWSDKVNKDFAYYVNANFSWLRNRVTDTGTTDENGNPGLWLGDVYGNDSFKHLTNLFQTTEGQPLNSYYLIKTDGIFKSDAEAAAYVDKNGKRIQPKAQAGDLKFVDADGDGEITNKDRQYCGSYTPQTTFGFTAGFNWKNLSFNAMFQGVGGAKALFVGKSLVLDDTEGNFNRWNKILDAWTPENSGSDIPRLSKNDPNGNFTTSSDWYLENASYLRLKNLTVGYDLTSQLRKLSHFGDRMSSLSVYVSAENLFTITKYSGMDPEVGGYDTMKYPVSRVFSFGVKLTY